MECKMDATMLVIHGASDGVAFGRAESHWPEILRAISNESFDVAEFIRLILIEMSLACHEIQIAPMNPSLAPKVKQLVAEIHALRTLGEMARYASRLPEADIVNLDGPKFEYILTQLLSLVMQSIEKAGGAPLLIDTIRTNFLHGIAEMQEEIRNNIDKVAAVPQSPGASLWPQSNSKTTDSANGSTASHPKSESETKYSD
jgi:hypothetical protein